VPDPLSKWGNRPSMTVWGKRGGERMKGIIRGWENPKTVCSKRWGGESRGFEKGGPRGRGKRGAGGNTRTVT